MGGGWGDCARRPAAASRVNKGFARRPQRLLEWLYVGIPACGGGLGRVRPAPGVRPPAPDPLPFFWTHRRTFYCHFFTPLSESGAKKCGCDPDFDCLQSVRYPNLKKYIVFFITLSESVPKKMTPWHTPIIFQIQILKD